MNIPENDVRAFQSKIKATMLQKEPLKMRENYENNFCTS
jgi:hypothetical protein